MTAIKVKDGKGEIKYFEVVGAGTELDPFRPIHQIKFPAPMPVEVVNIDNLSNSQAISGSVNVGNFPSVQQVGGNVEVLNFPTTQSVSGSVNIANFPLTQAVSGLVNVGNFPSVQQVGGNVEVLNFPTTQNVSGTVSVANFPITQAVSGLVNIGNFPSVQPVSGSVSVANFPASQTVNGTVAIASFPTTQTVNGSVNIGNFPATQQISGEVIANLGTTGNLASSSDVQQISDRLPSTLGPKTAANSLSATLSSDGIFATSFGNPSDAIATTDGGIFSFIGLFKRLLSIKLDLRLSDLATYLQNILTAIPSPNKPVLVRSLAKNWREDFNGTNLTSDWQVLQTGSGQTIAVTSSELRITAGTTANSETILRSQATFIIPFRTVFSCYLSQRIANQEIYLEIIDSTGNHYTRWQLSGTNTNLGLIATANGGNSIGSTSLTINPSNGYAALEIELSPDEINFYPRATDSANARSTGVVRTRQIPDPTLDYYLQIRVKNLSTAPASSTILYIDCITVQDIEEITTEITAGRGGGGANQALPVVFAATQTLNVNSISNTVNTNTLSNRDFTSSTITSTPLAANATYNSGTFTIANLNKVRGWIYADQSGTLFVEFSRDATSWRTIQTINYTANSVISFEQLLSGVNYRVRYLNGSVAQTTFELLFTQMGIGA